MGVLYNTVRRKQDAEAQLMINDLLALGITRARTGESIYDLSYYDLRHELAIAAVTQSNHYRESEGGNE
ncbi:hypothetical protein AS034_05285 [[Bacillus] enclensis]|uniref:Fur-regulated basic protein A n=1 Tax=[Bacillus] enclensis TaxID=1402860 RepID=A0A0V8HM70_9BACI|nr:hypothetical protein [[Bacillus] enclensis]KSU63661.1 hypothetical protein AS034_05285 [[Bacillus] enclensis]SCB87712.1 hypothetical protein GA0061094_1103 [[Bacillus] enclensis]